MQDMSDAQRLDPVNNKEHRFLHKAMNTDFFGEEKVLPKLDNQDPRYALFRAADLLSILLNKPEGYTKAELEPMIKNLGYMHLGIGQRDNQPPSPIGILDDYVTLQGGKWKIKKEYLTLDKEITIKYKKAGFQEVSLNYCNAIVSILNNTKMAQDNFKLNKVTMDLKPEEQQAKEEKKKNSVKKDWASKWFTRCKYISRFTTEAPGADVLWKSLSAISNDAATALLWKPLSANIDDGTTAVLWNYSLFTTAIWLPTTTTDDGAASTAVQWKPLSAIYDAAISIWISTTTDDSATTLWISTK